MCSYKTDPKRIDPYKNASDNDPARIALDDLIDFAIECVMEAHNDRLSARLATQYPSNRCKAL